MMLALLPLLAAAAAAETQPTASGPVMNAYVMLALVMGGGSLVFVVAAVLGLFITRREAENGLGALTKRVEIIEGRPVASHEAMRELKEAVDSQVANLFSKLGGVERGAAQKADELRKEIAAQLADLSGKVASVDKSLGSVETELRLLAKAIEKGLGQER